MAELFFALESVTRSFKARIHEIRRSDQVCPLRISIAHSADPEITCGRPAIVQEPVVKAII